MTLAHPSFGVDVQLVKRAQGHDATAFAQIVERYQPPIFTLCLRMLGDEAEAEDAAQETFLRAYLHLREYDCQRAFKTWLFSIASHYCIDCLRRRHLQFLTLEDEPATPAFAALSPGPEQTALRHEHSRTLRALLDRLSPADRLVIVLRYWFDFSYVEIASATNATVSAVKSRLHRARAELARRITRSGVEPGKANGIATTAFAAQWFHN
jgi:RNA polymerase sigma-70 factor (ECF subfamily)